MFGSGLGSEDGGGVVLRLKLKQGGVRHGDSV